MTCPRCASLDGQLKALRQQLRMMLHPVLYEPPYDVETVDSMVNVIEETQGVNYCEQPGPLIAREGIVVQEAGAIWEAYTQAKPLAVYTGSTRGVAAMRCFIGNR
jgi:hypothetical protein